MSDAGVFIDGEAGTTGLGIRERLQGVPGLRLLSIEPARRKDPDARREMMADADLVVLCLPDGQRRVVTIPRESVTLVRRLAAMDMALDADGRDSTEGTC